MRYDGHGRQSRWIFPSKTATLAADPNDYEEYRYDAAGNRTSLRKRDGSTLTYQYDALGRVTAKLVPERAGLAAIHTRDIYFGYDLRGLQTYARFDSLAGEGVTIQYDGFGRATASTLAMAGTSRTLASLYDAEGSRTRLTHGDGAVFSFAHDGLGRLVLVLDQAGLYHIDDYVIRYWYNAQGRRFAAVRGAGVVGFTTAHYYDPALRLTALINDLPVAGADMSIGLSYNPANQITQHSRDNDAYAWTGGVTASRDYAANGQNQYGSIASGGATIGSFAYDANGNLTSETNAYGTRNYVYDVENRLVSASEAASASLVYDPLGRLFQTSGGAAGVTQFLYDGDALVAEYNGSGALTRRYVHGPGVDEPVAVYNGPARGIANRRYTLADERGSIVGLVNADGTPSKYNTYDEYGFPDGNAERFQYTGQIWIPELGMYHYKSRLYSPGLGRFLQVDPVGYDGGLNLYAYVDNDPLNKTDPDGEIPREGSEDDERFLTHHKKVGEDIARSPTKVDDAILAGSVAVMAAPLAVLAAPEAATIATSAAASSAAPIVTNVTRSIAGRAVQSLRAPTINATRVTTRAPRPLTGTARTIQPDKVPASFSGAARAPTPGRTTPEPRTVTERVVEFGRFVMRVLNPFDE